MTQVRICNAAISPVFIKYLDMTPHPVICNPRYKKKTRGRPLDHTFMGKALQGTVFSGVIGLVWRTPVSPPHQILATRQTIYITD